MFKNKSSEKLFPLILFPQPSQLKKTIKYQHAQKPECGGKNNRKHCEKHISDSFLYIEHSYITRKSAKKKGYQYRKQAGSYNTHQHIQLWNIVRKDLSVIFGLYFCSRLAEIYKSRGVLNIFPAEVLEHLPVIRFLKAALIIYPIDHIFGSAFFKNVKAGHVKFHKAQSPVVLFAEPGFFLLLVGNGEKMQLSHWRILLYCFYRDALFFWSRYSGSPCQGRWACTASFFLPRRKRR